MGIGVSRFCSYSDLAKKNEQQSSYVSLRDLLQKGQTSFSTTLTTTPTKTDISGCGSYTMVEMYDKGNLDDDNLFVKPLLSYPDFSVSGGPKGMSNNSVLSHNQGILEIQDTMVAQAVKGRMSIEDLKAMLLDIMTIFKPNGRLRVHIVLEQLDSETEEKDNSNNSEGKVQSL